MPRGASGAVEEGEEGPFRNAEGALWYTRLIMHDDLQPLPILGWDVFRHYKGNEYRIICIARLEEDHTPCVVYQSIKDDTEIWIRPYDDFVKEIVVDGYCGPRFVKQ